MQWFNKKVSQNKIIFNYYFISNYLLIWYLALWQCFRDDFVIITNTSTLYERLSMCTLVPKTTFRVEAQPKQCSSAKQGQKKIHSIALKVHK